MHVNGDFLQLRTAYSPKSLQFLPELSQDHSRVSE